MIHSTLSQVPEVEVEVEVEPDETPEVEPDDSSMTSSSGLGGA